MVARAEPSNGDTRARRLIGNSLKRDIADRVDVRALVAREGAAARRISGRLLFELWSKGHPASTLPRRCGLSVAEWRDLRAHENPPSRVVDCQILVKGGPVSVRKARRVKFGRVAKREEKRRQRCVAARSEQRSTSLTAQVGALENPTSAASVHPLYRISLSEEILR
jgi:hypothetical protein